MTKPNLNGLVEQARSFVQQHFSKQQPLVVYEAGCGSAPVYESLFDERMSILGADADVGQLLKNKRNQWSVLTDIQQCELSAESVDFIVCFDVIEHLSEPYWAMEKFDSCLKESGLLLLAFPNIWSLKGIITKLTPYFIHKLFYRFVIGDRTAMGEDSRQFRTFLRPSISFSKVLSYFEQQGYVRHMAFTYEGPVPEHLRKRNAVYGYLFDFVYFCSLPFVWKFLDLRHSDVFILLEKQE